LYLPIHRKAHERLRATQKPPGHHAAILQFQRVGGSYAHEQQTQSRCGNATHKVPHDFSPLESSALTNIYNGTPASSLSIVNPVPSFRTQVIDAVALDVATTA
jgi:hypothetical protein